MNIYIRLLIGIILSIASVFATFYFAMIIEGGVTPVITIFIIAIIWMILFWDKRDKSGGNGGTMGE